MVSYTLISSTFSKEEAAEFGCKELGSPPPECLDNYTPFSVSSVPLVDSNLIIAILELLRGDTPISHQNMSNIYELILQHDNPIKLTKEILDELNKTHSISYHFSYILSHLLVKFLNTSNLEAQSNLINLMDIINRFLPRTFQYFANDSHAK